MLLCHIFTEIVSLELGLVLEP